jgi:hypothetical protein
MIKITELTKKTHTAQSYWLTASHRANLARPARNLALK